MRTKLQFTDHQEYACHQKSIFFILCAVDTSKNVRHDKNKTVFFNSFFTCISKSFILVPCWRSRLLSSFRSFCTNSAAALFFWVRSAAHIALYTTVLSSEGFLLGLSITPTRTPRLAFCLHTNMTVT